MRKKETPNPSRVRGRGVEVSETLFYGRRLAIYLIMIMAGITVFSILFFTGDSVWL